MKRSLAGHKLDYVEFYLPARDWDSGQIELNIITEDTEWMLNGATALVELSESKQVFTLKNGFFFYRDSSLWETWRSSY